MKQLFHFYYKVHTFHFMAFVSRDAFRRFCTTRSSFVGSDFRGVERPNGASIGEHLILRGQQVHMRSIRFRQLNDNQG